MSILLATLSVSDISPMLFIFFWANLSLLFFISRIHVCYAVNNIPTPNLPFQDINLVVLTDVHSWVGGHHQEGLVGYDVTYGDVVSFYEHLNEYCQSTNQDLWLIQNGDWIDGTGLAMNGDPSHLVPLIEKIPFDILNTGNHELYRSEVIDYMKRPGGFIDWWGHRYLASNVYMNDMNIEKKNEKEIEPLGNQYTVLEGKHSKILVFGFIYNLPNPSEKVMVQHVEDAIEELWFQHALTKTEGYNAIIVMIHAGHDDPVVSAIHTKIRQIIQNPNMPIQFIAGHTHYRRYAVADETSTIVEAGKYLDTIGWVSFPNMDTIQKHQRKLEAVTEQGNSTDVDTDTTSTSPPSTPTTSNTQQSNATTTTPSSPIDLFHHIFLDATVTTLQTTLGVSKTDFETPYGHEIKEFIIETRQKMGLTQKIGCAPQDYILNTSMFDDNSLWRLYSEEVVPNGLQQEHSQIDRVVLIDQGSWRYDLYGGNHLTYDDVIAVSPFNEPMYYVGTLPGKTILQLNDSLNGIGEELYYTPLPQWVLAGHVHADKNCELYTQHFDLPRVQNAARQLYPDLGDAIEQNMTSTTIWFSFVANKWQCSGGVLSNQWWDDKIHSSDVTKKMSVGMAVFVACVVLCGAFSLLFFVCRCICVKILRVGNNRRDYDDMMTSFQPELALDQNTHENGDDDYDSEEPVLIIT